MIFIFGFVAVIFAAAYLFGEELVWDYLQKFIVIWILIGFYAGQYSMRFPKAF